MKELQYRQCSEFCHHLSCDTVVQLEFVISWENVLLHSLSAQRRQCIPPIHQ